jgi:thiol-disulfide isomerase/thioredoxin
MIRIFALAVSLSLLTSVCLAQGTIDREWATLEAEIRTAKRPKNAKDEKVMRAGLVTKIDEYLKRWDAGSTTAVDRIFLGKALFYKGIFQIAADPKKAVKALDKSEAILKAVATADPSKKEALQLLKQIGSYRNYMKRQSERPQINRLRAKLIGQPAPPLSLVEMLDGSTPLTLGKFEGKVVLVDFWATWSGPCRETIPGLLKLRQKYGEKLVIIGVSSYYGYAYSPSKKMKKGLDKASERAMNKDCAQALGMTYLLGFSQKARHAYKVRGIPQLVVIDKRGIVRKIKIGGGDLSEVDKMIEICQGE